MKRLRGVTAAAGAATALFAGCVDADQRDSPVNADSTVVQISAPSEDRDVSWHFERLWHLDPSDDERLGFIDLGRHHIAVDSAGRIHILDEAARHVLVVSADGEIIAIIGRRGEGPGELTEPTSLTATRADVAVYDFGKQSLVRWGHTGDVLAEVRMPASFWGPLIRITGDDAVLFTSLARADASTAEQWLLEWSPTGQRQLAAMVRQPDRVAEFPSCGISGPPISPLFAPELVWDASGSRVAVNTGPEYRIAVFQDGARVRRIERDVSPRRVTRELALAEVGDGMPIPIADCVVPAVEVVQGRGYADVLPAVSDVVLAPDGELWVRRGTFRGERALIDVFAADGTYHGTLSPGSPFPAAFLPTGEIVVIEHDAFDAASVALYRIDR